MNQQTKTDGQDGVKSSNLVKEIEKKINLLRLDIVKVLGEEKVASAIVSLAEALSAEADSNKAVMTANANYLKKVPENAGALIEMHSNLTLHGVLRLPAKPKENKNVATPKATDEGVA